MKPGPFDYHRPRNIEEALRLLAMLDGEVRMIAGGQSLGPMLNLRLARPDHIVDLNDLATLKRIEAQDGALEIGALVRHHDVVNDAHVCRNLPILAAAAATIGHYAIRQRGTIGGSIAHADPAAQMPLIAVLLDAEIVCRSPRGERRLPARDFIRSIMTTALEPDEIVMHARVPVQTARTGWGFEIFSRRRGDFAIVAVAALLERDTAGRVIDLRIGVSGLADTPIRLDDITARFLNAEPDAAWLSGLADAVSAAGDPQDTPGIPRTFRIDLARTLTRRAVMTALERSAKAHPP
jgi:carbon-monoxide dehydrogenase medium subunit